MVARYIPMAALAGFCLLHFGYAQNSRNDARLQRILKRYPEADTNGDGILTEQEARAWMEKVRQTKGVPTAKVEAPAAPEKADTLGPISLSFDQVAPAEARIRPIMSFGMEGLFKLHAFDPKSAADPYADMIATLGPDRLEFLGGSSSAWHHLGPDPNEKQKAVANPPALCPACPASQRRGYYVWQSDVDKVNAIWSSLIADGKTKPHNYPYSLGGLAGLVHGTEVFSRDFWEDYKTLMRRTPSYTRSSVVFNVLNGTLDEARRQLDELASIRPVADVSLGVEQAIGGYEWKYDTKGSANAGREYARVVDPYLKLVGSYRKAHPDPRFDLRVFAAVPPLERYRAGVICGDPSPSNAMASRAACWQDAVNALPVDGIMQYSWARIGSERTAVSDEAMTAAIFKFTDEVKTQWNAYRQAYPRKRMIIGQWGLHVAPEGLGLIRGSGAAQRIRGVRALGEALFVPLFMFTAVAYDLDSSHPEQRGFLECLRFYQLKNLTAANSTDPIPSYHAFAMLQPAFQGESRIAWQGNCPGSDRCRLVLVETASRQSILYAINFRPGPVKLALKGSRGPGEHTVRIESITGPDLTADYNNRRALHAATNGTGEVTLAPRSFTAVSWSIPAP